MTATDALHDAALESWLRGFEGQHAAAVATVLSDAQPVAEDGAGNSGALQLSVATAYVAATAGDPSGHDHMIGIALRWAGDRDAPDGRRPLRILMPDTLRISAKSTADGLVISDVAVDANPQALDGVHLRLYAIARHRRAMRVLASLHSLMQAAYAAADDAAAVSLLLAATERLHLLEVLQDAELLIVGSAIGLNPGGASAGTRYLAFTPSALADARPEPLWVRSRQLLRGPTIESAAPVVDGPFVLLRIGPRSTRENLRRYIEELRRAHQLRGEALNASGKTESYLSQIAKEAEQRKQAVLDAFYGHHQLYPMVTPLAVEAAADLEAVVALGTAEVPTRFQSLLDAMRQHLANTFGVKVPGLRVRINLSDLDVGSYLIMIDEVPLVMNTAHAARHFCRASRDRLQALDPQAESATDPADGRDGAWIAPDIVPQAVALGFEVWEPAAFVVAHLQQFMRNHLRGFLHTDDLVDALQEAGANELAERMLSAPGGLARFRGALLALLDEQLPAKPLDLLARCYLERVGAPVAEIAEDFRCVDAVNAHLRQDLGQWQVFQLAADFVDVIARHVLWEDDVAVLALEPEATQEALAAVRRVVGTPVAHHEKVQVIVVDDWRLRPFVRRLVELEFPRLRVVARRELAMAALPAATNTIALDETGSQHG